MVFVRVLLLVTVLAAGVGVGSGAATTSVPTQTELRLVSADASGLEIEWTASPVTTRILSDGTLEVTSAGFEQTAEPGTPRLPFATRLIALPPGAETGLRIASTDEQKVPLVAPLALAPHPEGLVRDKQSRPIGGAFVAAAKEEPWDLSSPVVLEDLGVVRGVRLARLAFYPVIPEGNHLRIVRRVRLQVWWTERQAVPSLSIDGLQMQIQKAVLNPWDAIPSSWDAIPSSWDAIPSSWDTLPDAPSASPQSTRAINSPTAFVQVADPALYRVGYADLQNLGLTSGDPRNLRLFQGAQEVAYGWEGDGDATFEPGEALVFFAVPRISRWTSTDVLRLVADATAGLRITSRSADPAGLPSGNTWVEQLFEENHIYTPDCFCGHLPAGRDGDRWVWAALRQPDVTELEYPFQTPAVKTDQPATLNLWFIGYTNLAASPDHRVAVALNGASLGAVDWDDKRAITSTMTIAPGILHSGANTLTLSLPGLPGVPVEGAWLDAFAVRYARSDAAAADSLLFEGQSGEHSYTVSVTGTGDARAYDVTDPIHPQALTDVSATGGVFTLGDAPGGGPRRYFVTDATGVISPAGIRAAEDPWRFQQGGDPGGADLVVITHPEFTDALFPLVIRREAQGMQVAVVNVLGLFDTWGDGRLDPEAIRSFITHTYVSWRPRPLYALLVGDGSYDPRGYSAASPPTFVPPYLADVDPWAGETAADNRFVAVDGSDVLPDLFIGRLPVDSLAEAETMVEKIISYETQPFPGDWNSNVVLVADDQDSAGDFGAESETAAAFVNPPFVVNRRYCAGSSANTSDCSDDDVALIRGALSNDWARGALLVQYTGHSSWHQWAAERLLHLDDLGAVHNERRYPIALEMTCFTGAFQRPEATLDEQMVTMAGGGLVAAWGPTGLGVGTGHNLLSEGFFRTVFEQGIDSLGEATLAGKLSVAANGHHIDLVDTFVVLGDPSMGLNLTVLPWAHELFAPLLLNRR